MSVSHLEVKEDTQDYHQNIIHAVSTNVLKPEPEGKMLESKIWSNPDQLSCLTCINDDVINNNKLKSVF